MHYFSLWVQFQLYPGPDLVFGDEMVKIIILYKENDKTLYTIVIIWHFAMQMTRKLRIYSTGGNVQLSEILKLWRKHPTIKSKIA